MIGAGSHPCFQPEACSGGWVRNAGVTTGGKWNGDGEKLRDMTALFICNFNLFWL